MLGAPWKSARSNRLSGSARRLSNAPRPMPSRVVVFSQCAGMITSVSTFLSPNGIARPSTLSRSEEHTSELQSLMRSSYAVFCLKKQKYNLSHLLIAPPLTAQIHLQRRPYLTDTLTAKRLIQLS